MATKQRKRDRLESPFHNELERAGVGELLDASVMQRLRMAQHAQLGLSQGLDQLETVVARNTSRITLRVNDVDISGCAGYVDICRSIARAMFKKCRYFEFHLERITGIPESLRTQMKRAYYDFHQFAGDPDSE